MSEIEEFCQRILQRRFHGVEVYPDVRDIGRGISPKRPDVMVFGFPCQGISAAGRGLGLKDDRSGLWFECLRVVAELQPKMVLIENVRNLLSRGMPTVLIGLRSIGYDVEWDVIPAAAVGAAHLRERVWAIARPKEFAENHVYGDEARKKGELVSFSLDGKLPRAGRMNTHCRELEPIAPRKTKRKDGWTYWVGVNLWADILPTLPTLPTPKPTDGDRGGRGDLIQVVRGNRSPSGHFGSGDGQVLWPSSSRDHKDTGDLNCVEDNGLLPRRVFHVEQGTALLPTPDAYGNGNGPENHMRKKAERCGGPRNTISNLEVIARNGFAQANGRLWPTTTTDAKAARNETAGRSDPDSAHHSGTTLLDALIKDGDARVQRTVDPSASGDCVVKVIAPRRVDETLGLSTSGVSQASARCWPTPSAAAAQGPGNEGRAGGENLVTRVNGSLNPDWTEWLMAFPLGWTDLNMPNELLTQTPWWFEPYGVPRVALGIKDRSARLRAIGNAVVWPCAYIALERGLRATNLIP